MSLSDAWLGICLSFMMFGCDPSPDWSSVRDMIRRDFPDVENVSPEELTRALDTENAPVLLDVREQAEYDVSHLPGAIRVPPGSDGADVVDGLDRDTPIVAYCSVGYRSSELVQKLREKGFSDVKNLEGSIFAWANEGRPVEREGREVREVHPFDDEWGRLLDEELRAYEPGSR